MYINPRTNLQIANLHPFRFFYIFATCANLGLLEGHNLFLKGPISDVLACSVWMWLFPVPEKTWKTMVTLHEKSEIFCWSMQLQFPVTCKPNFTLSTTDSRWRLPKLNWKNNLNVSRLRRDSKGSPHFLPRPTLTWVQWMTLSDVDRRWQISEIQDGGQQHRKWK